MDTGKGTVKRRTVVVSRDVKSERTQIEEMEEQSQLLSKQLLNEPGDPISAAAHKLKSAIESSKMALLKRANGWEALTVTVSWVATIAVESSKPGKDVEKHRLEMICDGENPMNGPRANWVYSVNGHEHPKDPAGVTLSSLKGKWDQKTPLADVLSDVKEGIQKAKISTVDTEMEEGSSSSPRKEKKKADDTQNAHLKDKK